MLFPNTFTNKMSCIRLQFTTISLTFVILTLLIAYSQPSNAADYDGDGGGSELGSAGDGGGGGGASEVASGNDEIYETAVLQQDMEEHEKRQKLLEEMQEAMAELEENADSAAPPTVPTSAQPYDMSHESLNTIRAQARMDDVMTDSQEIEMMDSSTVMNGSAARAPIALPPTILPRSLSTMIPVYVRQGKAEQFPRTISGGSVSVEETDANVSTSDYVEDEEHMNVRAQKAHKIDPIAMKLYHHSEADSEDNMLKDQQPAPPSQQPQHVAAPQPRTQQLQPNSSDDDYYEDPQDSLEKLQLHHQHKVHRPTVPPALPLTPSPPIAAQPKSMSDVVDAIHRAQTNAARPSPAVPQARGAAWTTSGPLIDAAATPTTTVYGENTIDAITPNIAATTSSAMATGFDTESAAAAVAAALSTTTQTPTTATATTAATTTTTFTTTIRPAGKQGKQINITRGRKLLPHEQLRNYIEDAYIRMPLAVIVDPSADALEKTKALWREALRTNLNIKIVLVSLNASGIPAAYSFNNTRQFLAGLNSIKVKDGGNSFVGIVHASELVPYDSAVFISTAVIPPHTELVQDAAITLLKKRIRLYLIWYGERSVSENETQEAVGGILGEVAIRSGGEVLHLVGSENSQELEGSTLTLVADAYVGTQEVDIPVDTTLSSLHVKIDAPMRTATLETPNGDINLKKLVKFKSLVLTLGADDSRLDAYVPLNKLRKATVYKLKIVPESLSDEYSVFVRAERKSDLFLDDLIKRFDAYFMKDRNAYPINLYGSHLISLMETSPERSPATHANLRFDSNEEPKAVSAETAIIGDAEVTMPKDQVETFSDNEIHSNRPNKPTNNTGVPTSIVNVGYKYNGVARGTTATLLQRDTTKIEMGLQSQLLLAPGMLGTLEFEVTNTRTEAVYHNIQVIDERRFLMRLNPQSIFLRAGEMAKVIVTVLIPNGTPQGTTDKITFTCHGGGTSSLSLNLKVVSSTAVDVQDTTAPTVSWTFGSRCDNVNAQSTDCAERFWTLDITAQDWQSGILRLQSVPSGGLLYRNSYTVGSTEPLKATYIATCCEPKVALTAFDVTGNQRSYNVDVRDLVLTEASIAAIVLGALLLLLLIILLIWAIVWCCRRRQVSLDLPTYRSHSTRSME